MPKYLTSLLLLMALGAASLHALTVDSKPGELKNLIPADETVTGLTITGAIDASDLYFIASQLPELTSLDLSQAKIEAYSGPRVGRFTSYAANAIPAGLFAASPLKSIAFPAGRLSIGKGAFAASSITEVTLGENVAIGIGAFTACPALAKATIGCAAIPEGAFADCTSLSEVALTAPAVTVGSSAFSGCTSLVSLSGSASISSIGDKSFANCLSIKDFTFGPKLTDIGAEAFTGTGLSAIDLSGCTALDSVGDWAFARMPSLTRASLGSVPVIGKGILFQNPSLQDIKMSVSVDKIPDFAYSGNAAADTTGILPEGITRIGSYAMSGLTGATTLELPGSVESLGDGAMERMKSLTRLTVKTTSPATLGDDVWADVPQRDVTLIVPEGAENAYSDAAQWREFIIKAPLGTGDAVADQLSPALKARFVGHELQLSIDGVEIQYVTMTNPAGSYVVNIETSGHELSIDTADLPGPVYILNAILGDGRTATLKLSKKSR